MFVRLNMAPDTGDNHGSAGSVPPNTESGEGSAASSTWRDDLPEPLKTSKTLAKFKSKDALAQSYIELEAKQGNSVQLPGKDAKPEDWEQFYSRVGRPASSDDYALETVEGFQADDSFMKRLKGELHALGATPAQANRFFKFVAGEAVGSRRVMSEAKAQAEAANQEALKAAFGTKLDEKIELARRFAAKVGGDEAVQYLEKGAIKDPVLMRLLAAAGEATGAHRFVDGVTSKGQASKPYAYMNEGR